MKQISSLFINVYYNIVYCALFLELTINLVHYMYLINSNSNFTYTLHMLWLSFVTIYAEHLYVHVKTNYNVLVHHICHCLVQSLNSLFLIIKYL